MNFNEEDIRSDVGFVCIGQAAGNIGLLFEEKGYNVLYINTSSEDLALLKNAKHVYHVPNGEGCAKDRDKAKYHLANDIDHLLDLIETKVPQKNVFVVFASGGGTGSGISPYLLNILVEKFSTDEDGELSANPAKLFSAITILPSDSEPLQPAINSYSCCKEILDIENLGTVFFIDNNSMEDKMKINKVFVSELDTVLSIPALHKSVKLDSSVAYKVVTEAWDYNTQQIVVSDGKKVRKVTELHVDSKKPENSSFDVSMSFKTDGLGKHRIVIFEYVYDNKGNLISKEADFDAESQTIYIDKTPNKTGDRTVVFLSILAGMLGLGVVTLFVTRRKKK